MKKVSVDGDAMAFNTAISALMVFTNHLSKLKEPPKEGVGKLVLMLSPFAPHVAEECWEKLGGSGTMAYEGWVTWDEELCIDNTAKMGIQVDPPHHTPPHYASHATCYTADPSVSVGTAPCSPRSPRSPRSQVNGKVRGDMELAKDASEDDAMEVAMAVEGVAKFVDGKTPKKIIYVPGKILNIIV